MDPPRDDTAHTVSVCRRAGIRFAMVTGDFALTAESIARQVGIITTRPSDVKHISDLQRTLELDRIPDFDDNKAPDAPMTSLVLNGPDLTTMTKSQWKQLLTVRAFDTLFESL